MRRFSAVFAPVLFLSGSTAFAGEQVRVVVVEQPAITLPFVLVRGTEVERVRLNLPSVVETIEIAGHRVRFLANDGVPAVLDTTEGWLDISVRFGDATATAQSDATASLSRTIRLRDGDTDLGVILVESELDLSGLASKPAHITFVESAACRVEGFEGAELQREVMIATPSFPLRLAAPALTMKLERDAVGLSGTIVIRDRIVSESTVALQLFDRTGSLLEIREVDIVWTKRNDRWVGELLLGDMPQAARATLTLGKDASARVVQAASAVPGASS